MLMKQTLFLFLSVAVAWMASVTGGDVAQAWVAAAIGAGAGILSSLYGGAKAGAAARKAQGYLNASEADEQAWYDKTYNQNYADTAAGQNLLRKANDFAEQNWKRAEGAARVAGGTETAAARAKEAGNKMMGDTVATIASNDTSRKDSIDMAHRQRKQQTTGMRMDIENNRAAQITQAASQASNALMTAGALMDSPETDDSVKGFFKDLLKKKST